MHAALLDKIKAKGGLSANALVPHIERLEEENVLPVSGLSVGMVAKVIIRDVKSMTETQWDNIDLTLESLPDSARVEYVQITDALQSKLEKNMDRLGGIGAELVLNEIQKYQEAKGLDDTGLKIGTIHLIIKGKQKNVLFPHWQRLNAVLDSLPDAEKRIEITDVMFAELQRKIAPIGGAQRVLNKIKEYQEAEGLKDTGLKMSTLHGVITGTQKKLPSPQWERLNLALDQLSRPKDSPLRAVKNANLS
jgi:hypothetical protein